MQCRRFDVIVALISDWSFQTNQFLLLDFFSRLLMMAFVLYMYFFNPVFQFFFRLLFICFVFTGGRYAVFGEACQF